MVDTFSFTDLYALDLSTEVPLSKHLDDVFMSKVNLHRSAKKMAPMDSLLFSIDGSSKNGDDVVADEEMEMNPSLDPTPIGPHGVKVVDEIPLTDIIWNGDRSVIDCLRPLMKRQADAMDDLDNNNIDNDNNRQIPVYIPTPDPIRPPSNKRQRRDSDRSTTGEEAQPSSKVQCNKLQIRAHQTEQWCERYGELVDFREEHGHCVVPYHFKRNLSLALWVKRQRHQYKLKKEGEHSTMTDEREAALDQLGFVWDSHKAVWEERLNELIKFRDIKGHCNVPAKYPPNPQLAIWVKCQRRQYKLYCAGERSNMTIDRIEKLNEEGFVWNPRKHKPIQQGHK